jgi:hypothetical protein
MARRTFHFLFRKIAFLWTAPHKTDEEGHREGPKQTKTTMDDDVGPSSGAPPKTALPSSRNRSFWTITALHLYWKDGIHSDDHRILISSSSDERLVQGRRRRHHHHHLLKLLVIKTTENSSPPPPPLPLMVFPWRLDPTQAGRHRPGHEQGGDVSFHLLLLLIININYDINYDRHSLNWMKRRAERPLDEPQTFEQSTGKKRILGGVVVSERRRTICPVVCLPR